MSTDEQSSSALDAIGSTSRRTNNKERT